MSALCPLSLTLRVCLGGSFLVFPVSSEGSLSLFLVPHVRSLAALDPRHSCLTRKCIPHASNSLLVHPAPYPNGKTPTRFSSVLLQIQRHDVHDVLSGFSNTRGLSHPTSSDHFLVDFPASSRQTGYTIHILHTAILARSGRSRFRISFLLIPDSFRLGRYPRCTLFAAMQDSSRSSLALNRYWFSY
ncbi:hypothetical protein K438DRAFT_1140222 [Mycena galopus ATCC 62051]|nr:hypothetical protein K438DRAFT_1140222 [Mycena galopus ATCC 62051]